MHDSFTGQPTAISGGKFPAPVEQAGLLDDHQRRLEALDRLRATAAQCGIATDPDRDLLLIPEDEVSVLQAEGGAWADLWKAIQAIRGLLPILPLERFGFPATSDDPMAEGSDRLSCLGSGVEAWAFQDEEGSVYKFFMPHEASPSIGASFSFRPDDQGPLLQAMAVPGSYRNLLEKLHVLNALGGMPTEVIGITPEGILISKQTQGRRLSAGTETSILLPESFICWPSRFLRCDRDHPRLVFLQGQPWLVGDLHERNIVYDHQGAPRIIDLVAGPLPKEVIRGFPLIRTWIERVRLDPNASLLNEAPDADL